MNELHYEQESYNIIGACIAVHQELGAGFLETVYQEALEEEFKIRKIPYTKEALIHINYKGKNLQKKFKADFICYGKIILELKAVTNLNPSHKAQVINYLKATNMQLGLLINFGEQSLTSKRIINKNQD